MATRLALLSLAALLVSASPLAFAAEALVKPGQTIAS